MDHDFFRDLLWHSPAALRRFGLVVHQIHAIGNRSLVIILASGLAVGFVLALQMYYALVTYGATESLGLIVNLALVRELGPVVAALLFAGRAGTSLTAEIGLMKAGEQLSAMEMMAVDPRSRVLAPRVAELQALMPFKEPPDLSKFLLSPMPGLLVDLAVQRLQADPALRLGLGSVLGYLLAGLAIGPFGLRLVSDPAALLHVSELGVVLLLFVIGLELSPQRLWVMRRQVFGLGGLQVALSALALGLDAARHGHACAEQRPHRHALGDHAARRARAGLPVRLRDRRQHRDRHHPGDPRQAHARRSGHRESGQAHGQA